MKKKHFHLSFKVKLIFVICILNMITIVMVSLFNFQRYSDEFTSQVTTEIQQTITQLGTNIDTYIEEMYRLTLTPYYNDQIMGDMESVAYSVSDKMKIKREIEDYLASVMILPRDEILRVYLMNDDNIYSYTRTNYDMSDYENYQESSWYKAALKTTKPIYIPPHMEKVFSETKKPVFSVVRVIRSKKDNNRILGVIKVDADYTRIKKICDQVQLKNDGGLFIINDENQVIYCTAKLTDYFEDGEIDFGESAGSMINGVNGKRYILNQYTIISTGMKIVALNSYDELMEPFAESVMTNIFFSFICILLSAVIFAMLINRFLQPVSNIVETMHEVEAGNLNCRLEATSDDELGYLCTAFNSMVYNLQLFIESNTKLTKDIYETQYLYKESQYNALCSQIKPHFIYNTLNTISLLIKCDENKKAILVIEAFSTYLGGIMNVSKNITINSEIQICKAYLTLVQLRYEDRVSYTVHLDESIGAYRIPALLIQPLVENAVKYGAEPNRNPTCIDVTVAKKNGQCDIIVSDNGAGMDTERLAEITNKLRGKPDPDDAEGRLLGSLGIINIYKRLNLKYGDQMKFSIQSRQGEGTTVEIIIPLKNTYPKGGNDIV